MNLNNNEALAIDVKGLTFSYGKGKNKVSIFENFNFTVKEGEFVAIKGSSGSGKSTLFYLMSGLLTNYTGEVSLFDRDISRLDEKELSLLRNQTLGFVFQQFYLLPRQNVLQNILLPSDYPLEYASQKKQREEQAKKLARDLEIHERLDHLPSELSGGQQQRVAIARALLNQPKLIFADEPTGNLDSKSSATIMEYLKKIHKEGKTILLITHEDEVAKEASRIVTLKDGRVVEDIQNKPSSENSLKKTYQEEKKKAGNLFFNVLPIVLMNAFQNKVRTFLTMIGVIIGVASVCSLVTIGKYVEDRIMDGFQGMGANVTTLSGHINWNLRATDQYPRKFNFFEPEHDVDPLYDLFSKEIVMMTPYLEAWDSNVAYAGLEVDTGPRLYGINHFGHKILGQEIVIGKGINSHHVENKSPVCVIGNAFLGRLFKNESPVGKIIKVTNNSNNVINCEVIGLLAPIQTAANSKNLDVYLPYTFFREAVVNWWRRQIREIAIQISPDTNLVQFKNALIGWFKNKYGVSGNFWLNSNSLLREQMKRFIMLFNILLASIAVISLVVGGMGIANMMLISVSERLNEIGIRKSFGATKKSIRLQFILESLLVCSVAGIIGILLGFAFYETLIYVGSKYLDKVKFVWLIEWNAIVWSFLSIVIVGVVSGLIPALKAEKTEVIDALRSD